LRFCGFATQKYSTKSQLKNCRLARRYAGVINNYMAEVKEIGKIIATRNLIFVREDGSSENVTVNIGAPYEWSAEGDCCCPYQLISNSRNKLHGMVGIDTLQALELTMKTLNCELEYWEKTFKGKFHFLGEEGHCCSF
jgi:uncharacterized protein with PIN domain